MEPLGRNLHGDGLVGAAQVVVGHPGVEHLLGVVRESKRRPVSSSVRRVLWNRSILPVVVGQRTPVSR